MSESQSWVTSRAQEMFQKSVPENWNPDRPSYPDDHHNSRHNPQVIPEIFQSERWFCLVEFWIWTFSRSLSGRLKPDKVAVTISAESVSGLFSAFGIPRTVCFSQSLSSQPLSFSVPLGTHFIHIITLSISSVSVSL